MREADTGGGGGGEEGGRERQRGRERDCCCEVKCLLDMWGVTTHGNENGNVPFQSCQYVQN